MASLKSKLHAVEIAKSLLYQPYIWGGNDPMDGFDCSGLIIEILKSVGKLDREGDWTADDLSKILPESDSVSIGSLLFYDWSLNGRMEHVEFVLDVLEDGTVLTIGASGGDSTVNNIADAMRKNAYVKMRPARPNHAKVCDPFK